MVDKQGWVNMLPQMWQSTDQESLDNHVVERMPIKPKFSKNAFINALVKFIVADDQVS